MPRSFLVKKAKHPVEHSSKWGFREPLSPSEGETAPASLSSSSSFFLYDPLHRPSRRGIITSRITKDNDDGYNLTEDEEITLIDGNTKNNRNANNSKGSTHPSSSTTLGSSSFAACSPCSSSSTVLTEESCGREKLDLTNKKRSNKNDSCSSPEARRKRTCRQSIGTASSSSSLTSSISSPDEHQVLPSSSSSSSSSSTDSCFSVNSSSGHNVKCKNSNNNHEKTNKCEVNQITQQTRSDEITTVSYTYDAFFMSDGRSRKKPDESVEDEEPKRMVRDKQRYTCSECGKHYATSSNLSRHKQTHRSPDSQLAKKCPTCNKVYVSMPALAMHLLTHNLNHCCTVCGKSFSRPWLLHGHMRSHTGEKPFGCAHCGKAFADRSNLRAHMQTHSTFKHFTCRRCNKSFALKSYLNKHYESSCFKETPQTPSDSSPSPPHSSALSSPSSVCIAASASPNLFYSPLSPPESSNLSNDSQNSNTSSTIVPGGEKCIEF